MRPLITRVASKGNLREAWENLRHRDGSRGIDDITIEDFRNDLSKNLQTIRDQLLSGEYKFHKLRGHALSKGEGKIRPLRIPAVRDRVVQRAIHKIIYPPLNRTYNLHNPASYAYIRKRSVYDAAYRIRSYLRKGHRWIFVADIVDFFESVDSTLLCDQMVLPVLSDRSLDSLIKDGVRTDIGNMDLLRKLGFEAAFSSGEIGISQGGVLSPLFANVYLSGFDKKVLAKRFAMTRYADDLAVLCRSRNDAEKAHDLCRSLLSEIKLSLHPLHSAKCQIKEFGELKFLGLRFEGDKVYPADAALEKMIKKLRNYARHPPDEPLVSSLAHLRSCVFSWAGTYFYTDFDPVRYEPMEEALSNAVARVICKCGFTKGKNRLTAAQMKRIGVVTFQEAISTMLRTGETRKRKLIDFDEIN